MPKLSSLIFKQILCKDNNKTMVLIKLFYDYKTGDLHQAEIANRKLKIYRILVLKANFSR